jgi:hypothetical protein
MVCEVFMRFLPGLMVVCWGWLGCAAGPETTDEPATYGRENGRVWVSGPWEAIQPSSDMDEVVDQLCPAIMKLPRAKDGDYGREYCGVIYSLDDGLYYASHPSRLTDLRAGAVSPVKNCYVPRDVRDTRGQSVPLGDYHSHPWAHSSMLGSPGDMRSKTQVYSIRIQFDTACKLQKLIPHVNEERPGELYERRGKRWKLIGLIKPENKATGIITRVDD